MDFLVRAWTAADLDNLVRHANNPRVASTMVDAFPHPFTARNGTAFLASVGAESPPRVLCIEVEGQAAGAISLEPMFDIWRANAELGYWLAEPYWGQGIASRAVRQMVDYGFSHWPIERIFARPFASNQGSLRVLEKAGFKLEGRLERSVLKAGVYQDELIYAVLRPR
jgi:RimJ/RimL family protein N-acetyltransferase